MNKKSGGFTLVEIIVVIAILGTIAAIAVPRLTGFTSIVKESVVCIEMRNNHLKKNLLEWKFLGFELNMI